MPSAAHCDAQVLAQPSLPKARQWLVWLTYHYAELPGTCGWERGFRDSLLGLHHAIANSARRLRGNPTWDLQGTMTDDTESLEERAAILLANFAQINKHDIPLRFEKALDLLFGALRQQQRLGREIDRMRATGEIEVDVYFHEKSGTSEEQ